MSELPESLRVVPNIPTREQTIDQLKAERDYWHEMIMSSPSWGAAVAAAYEFRAACEAELKRREDTLPEPPK